MNRLFLLCLILFSTQSVIATEPLHDELTSQGNKGDIFPSKCCWLNKPDSKELRKIQRDIIEKRSCSAIGGPVSKLKLEKDKLFLTSLYKCGGNIELSEVYPSFKKTELAVWLTDTYHANLNYLCRDKNGKPVYEIELKLIVDKGIVMSKSTVTNNKSACAK